IQRDHNRVWWWTAGTFTLWGMAIFMVLLMMIHYALIFPLQAKLHGEAEMNANAELPKERIRIEDLTPDQLKKAQFKAQILFQMATVGVAFSVGLSCFAVFASVMLNRASRRATL